MPAPTHKFGDFELDPSSFELRRQDRPLKLERIPMELLILLVEKNGQVVSRQEIIERLWGKDVFIDTEHQYCRSQDSNGSAGRRRAAAIHPHGFGQGLQVCAERCEHKHERRSSGREYLESRE